MNAKQFFLGLSAIWGLLVLSILFWAILNHSGVLCLNATLYNEFWPEFITIHLFLIATILCFGFELFSYFRRWKLRKLVFYIKDDKELQYTPIKRFLNHLLKEFNNQKDILLTKKFKEFGFEDEEKFEYFLKILQKQSITVFRNNDISSPYLKNLKKAKKN